MNWFLFLSVTLIQSLVIVNGSAFKDSLLKERTETFHKEFDHACGENIDCKHVSVLAAQFCSAPTASPFCQTDCQFLIKTLSKLAQNLEPIDEVLTELPDDCCYKEHRDNEHADSKCENPDEKCEVDKEFQIEVDVRMTRDGRLIIEDSNIRKEIESHDEPHTNELEPTHDSAPVPPEANEVTNDTHAEVQCLIPEHAPMHAGDVTLLPCKEVYGEKFTGDAITFCSITGELLQSSALCVLPSFSEPNFADTNLGPLRTSPLEGPKLEDLTKYKDDIKKAADVLKKVKSILGNKKVKEFLPIAKKISSFLGPVGVAFQVVLFFIPDGPDKKHEAIMASLKTLEENTEEIIHKLDKLNVVIKKELFKSQFDAMIVDLKNLESTFKRYAENPSVAMKSQMYDACKKVNGETILNFYLNLFESRSLPSIAEMYDYHQGEFMDNFGQPAIINSIRGMSAAVKCLAMVEKVTNSDITHLSDDLQPKLVKITENIQKVFDDTIPKLAISAQLEADVQSQLKILSGSDNNAIAEKIREYLEEQYDFYSFGVTVQNSHTENENRGFKTSCNKCAGAQKNGGMYLSNHRGKNIIVLYSYKEHCTATKELNAIEDQLMKHRTFYVYKKKKNTQYTVDKVFGKYGNKPFQALAIVKGLQLGHNTQGTTKKGEDAPKYNSIGRSYFKKDYICFYVC